MSFPSGGFPPPNDPYLSAFTLLDAVYADSGIGISASSPTDIAISDPIALGPNSKVLVIATCIVQAGAGTTAINAAIGIHHPDGSGGSTPSNLQITLNAGETYKVITRMFFHSPGQWADATYRLGITQVGGTAAGNAFGVGLAVFGRPY